MAILKKTILLLLLFFFSFNSCKKSEEEAVNLFPYEEEIYIGSRHLQELRYIIDSTIIFYDSITLKPIGSKDIRKPVNIDTIFADTIRIEVSKDTISFQQGKVPINENNSYDFLLGSHHWLTYTIIGDTLKWTDLYVINRGSDYASSGGNAFIGIKQ